MQTLREQITQKSKHQIYTKTNTHAHTHTHKYKMIFAVLEPAGFVPVDSALEDHWCPLLLVYVCRDSQTGGNLGGREAFKLCPSS